MRPGGLLLDLHPEPEQPTVGVVLADGAKVHLGWIDNTAPIANIRAARAALASVVEQHWFHTNAHWFRLQFALRQCRRMGATPQERRATSIVDPAIIDGAREICRSQQASCKSANACSPPVSVESNTSESRFAGIHVVEIGCGDGRLIWRYAHIAATVLGLIRSNPTSITRAEARQGICIRE